MTGNHWSHYLDDPERFEYVQHADGIFGAFRIVDHVTNDVVCFGQACYSTEYLESLMGPEELAAWRRCQDACTPAGAPTAIALQDPTAQTLADPPAPSAGN